MANANWQYDGNEGADILLDEVLTPAQEKPLVPEIAELLEKREPEMDLHLHLTPTQDTQEEVTSLPRVPSLNLVWQSEDSVASPTFDLGEVSTPGNLIEHSDDSEEDPLHSLAQPFFTQAPEAPSDAKNSFEMLMDGLEEESLPSVPKEKGIAANSTESILDSEGYIKQPPKRIYRYKPGRKSIVIGNTGARGGVLHKTSSVLGKRRADVDISSLLGELPDTQSVDWTSSMESGPARSCSRPPTPDLFDDSDD